MFCIVRNPIDVFPSLASLMLTGSHSLEFNEKINERFPKFWNEWVSSKVQNMKYNHEFVLESISNKIPTLILRYEDLVLNPVKELTDLFCFLLDVPSIEGTVLQSRINTVVQAGQEKT